MIDKESKLNSLINYLFKPNDINGYYRHVHYRDNQLNFDNCFVFTKRKTVDGAVLKLDLNKKIASIYTYMESYHNGDLYDGLEETVAWLSAVDYANSILNDYALIKMKNDIEREDQHRLNKAAQEALDKLIGEQ